MKMGTPKFYDTGNQSDDRGIPVPASHVRRGFPYTSHPLSLHATTKMGNFWKKGERRRNDSDQPSPSVKETTSVTSRAAGPITLEPHTHRPLDQGQLHSPTLTAPASRPVNVSSVAKPKEISDPDETKTLEVAEQSQVPLNMETDVPASSVSATEPRMESGKRPKTLVAVPGGDGSRTGHSTRTGEDGGSVTDKTGHFTRTKRKHKTVTHKRQHGELRLVRSISVSIPSSSRHNNLFDLRIFTYVHVHVYA